MRKFAWASIVAIVLMVCITIVVVHYDYIAYTHLSKITIAEQQVIIEFTPSAAETKLQQDVEAIMRMLRGN